MKSCFYILDSFNHKIKCRIGLDWMPKLKVNRIIHLSFRCDCILGTPPMFIDILAHPDLKKYDLTSLRKGKQIF